MTGAVLLAGGTSAAGTALAEELLRRGFPVVITGRSIRERMVPALTTTDAREVAPAVRCRADLTVPQEAAALPQRLADAGIRIGHLVHLIGGWSGGRGVVAQTEERFTALAESFIALRHISRACMPHLLLGDASWIVSVSSPLAATPTANSANYSAVKAATEAWTLALDAELRAGTHEGAAAVVVTDGLAGREAGFACLVADIIEAPASRVAGQRLRHL